MKKLFAELKRRNVIKASLAYLVISWVLLQVADIVLPVANSPEWVLKTFTFFLAIGFPLWIFISWVYEVTPEGVKKTTKVSKDLSVTATTNKRLNMLILIGILAAIIISFVNRPTSNSQVLVAKNNTELSNSIAVLPFKDMSPGKDTEWFSDGVTEDILSYLSKIKGLTVISRTSTARYRESDKSIPEIAQELGVSYLVEGSVRKQGNKVLITVQLINANDEHLWADKYNENLDDVFKIQQDVAKKIVQQLKIVISPEEEKSLSSSSTKNIEAYQMVLKGRAIMNNTHDKDKEIKSIPFFEQAVALDPNYADAYAEIANSYYCLGIKTSDISQFEDAKVYVDKALIVNSNTALAYAVLGGIMYFLGDHNLEAFKENLEKALQINPNDVNSRLYYALYYYHNPVPDLKKALVHINLAGQLEPLSYPINQYKVKILIANQKILEAETLYNKISYMLSTGDRIYYGGLINSLKNNDLTELITAYTNALEKEANDPSIHYHLSRYYAGILNDDANSIKYARDAFELKTTSFSYASRYLYSLYYGKEFEKANSLLNDTSFTKLFSESRKTNQRIHYHVYQGEYQKALPYVEILKATDTISYYNNLGWIAARKGDTETVYSILNSNDYDPSDYRKTFWFALLKEKDSMYHYLNKISEMENVILRTDTVIGLNERDEFNPYRNDPRYKAHLNRNYLPVVEGSDL